MNKEVRVAQSSAELQLFLEETARRSNLKLSRIAFTQQNEWSTQSGALSHSSNGFFHIVGIINRTTREEHLVLFQPQSALTGLAVFRDGPHVYVLLQARVEPGLLNIAQYGPTIQSTPTNYLQMHGGRRTSYLSLFRGFDPIANPLANNLQSDLGKRYFQKNKIHSYLELAEQISTEDNMIWVPLDVIRDVIAKDNFLNPDLRSLLSGFDWDLFVGAGATERDKRKDSIAVQFALPANLLGKNDWQLVPLEQLTGWEIREYGVEDVSDSGIWVDMFNISCHTREVEAWSQPLMSCASQGSVVLLVRKVEDHHEFLVTIESEFGISGQRTVLPTSVDYPGESTVGAGRFSDTGTVMAEMVLSEEGNRFYKNESIYRLLSVADDIETMPNQKWVSAETLKSILTSSNVASLQLRSIASLLLDLLNPIATQQ